MNGNAALHMPGHPLAEAKLGAHTGPACETRPGCLPHHREPTDRPTHSERGEQADQTADVRSQSTELEDSANP